MLYNVCKIAASDSLIAIDPIASQIFVVNRIGEITEPPAQLFHARLVAHRPEHRRNQFEEDAIWIPRFRTDGAYSVFDFADPGRETIEAIAKQLEAAQFDMHFRVGPNETLTRVEDYETWDDDEDSLPLLSCCVNVVVVEDSDYVAAILNIDIPDE